MKKTEVRVLWPHGLHLRSAAGLVKLAQTFHSQIRIRFGAQIADAASIMNVLILCAGMNTILEVEAQGEDEEEAISAISGYFQGDDPEIQKI